jgi:hypothetical protein
MSGVVWNEKTLNSFLEDARGYIPGCKHNMPGKYFLRLKKSGFSVDSFFITLAVAIS